MNRITQAIMLIVLYLAMLPCFACDDHDEDCPFKDPTRDAYADEY